MANDSDIEHVWKLAEKVRFCMLSTHEGEDIRARPMAAFVDRNEHAIYFLSDVESPKDEDIARDPNVGLVFADAGDQNYVSISGHAQITNDRQKIKELWSTPAKAWWDSPEDPSIRVLRVSPKDAQYWDSPGTAVGYVKMLAAAVSDTRPAMDDNAKVNL